MNLYDISNAIFTAQSAYHGILFFACYFKLRKTENKEVWQKEA